MQFVVRGGEDVIAEARCEEAPAVRQALKGHDPLCSAIVEGVMSLAVHKVGWRAGAQRHSRPCLAAQHGQR